MRRLPLAIVLAASPATLAQVEIDGVRFVDRTAAGHVNLGAPRGGLAVLDVDGDGWMDLAIAENANASDRLFRNVPDPVRQGFRTFQDVSATAGLGDADGLVRGPGAILAFDHDNDGDTDLFMTALRTQGGFTHGLLYSNNGDGTFTNTSIAAGVRASGYITESAAAADYDLDGDADILIGCLDGGVGVVRLLRNQGDGTFVDASGLLPALSGFTHVYSMTWTDADADGWPDCILVNSGASAPVLLRNISDGVGGRRFEDAASLLGFTFLGPAPMGIAIGDMDGDGDLDFAATDADVGTYYENLGGSYQRVTPFETFFGWGIAWFDVDNDADLDHFQAGSWPVAAAHNRLVRNDAGAWTDISPALNDPEAQSQYSSMIDIGNDGRVDLIVVNPGAPASVSVLENDSTTPGHWITLAIRGDGRRSNADAIGAVVRVTAGGVTQVREISCGSSTTSSEDPRPHFGLGSAGVVDRIDVTWPRAGTLTTRTETWFGPMNADAILTIVERCPADLDQNGVLNIFDFLGFQTSFSEARPEADLAAPFGTHNVFDFLAFQSAFGAGC